MRGNERLKEQLGGYLCLYCPLNDENLNDGVCEGRGCDSAIYDFMDENESFFYDYDNDDLCNRNDLLRLIETGNVK